MAVSLNPPELAFRRPFNHEVTQLLRLANQGKEPLAFKVKTTAPKQYCVRPNSGRIEAGGDVEVQVLLQAMREEPALDSKCKDKFLVQSVAITPERDSGNIAAIWQNIEQNAKGTIQEKKIRVVFLPANGAVHTPNHKQVNGLHPGEDAPPAYGSVTPSHGSPAQDAVTPNTTSVDPNESRPYTDNKGLVEKENDASASVSSSTGATALGVDNSLLSSNDDIEAQLTQAKEKIKALTAQIDEQGLKQRKADAVNQDSRERITTGTTGLGVQQQPADGVPVQIVAALCLLSFLLAYFFF